LDTLKEIIVGLEVVEYGSAVPVVPFEVIFGDAFIIENEG
jgi:hypothetical protein